MRVFLGWSGDRSREVAVAFDGWLPKVIQALRPWVSGEDIEKGTVWFPKIANELKECQVGILFITPENVNSTWVHFEAGALSKTVDKESYVCPYLLELQTSQVKGPLAHFQLTLATKADTRLLLDTLNDAIGEEKLSENTLEASFEAFWPQLESELKRITGLKTERSPPARPAEEILEEVLNLVRSQATRQELQELLKKLQQVPSLAYFGSPFSGYSSPYDAPGTPASLISGGSVTPLAQQLFSGAARVTGYSGASQLVAGVQPPPMGPSPSPSLDKGPPPPASTGKESKRKPEK